MEPVPGRGVALLLQGLALDLDLHDPTGDLVQLRRHGVDLDPEPSRRLVHEVDGLVGQEAIGDVTVGQHGRRHQRRILDADAVMDLVALLEPAQDGDRVLHRGLVHHDGLEPPLQRRVLLDVLLVLVEGRGPDTVELPAGQRGLEQVARIHGPLGRAGAHDGVQLVNEENDLALRVVDGLEHRLEALLEFAAILRPRDQRAHVEGHDPLALEPLGHVAPHDPLGQPLHDRRLADARWADQHRVVLGAAREDLDDAADLLVAADDGVEFALLGERGKVPPVLLEGLVRPLRRGARHALAAPDGRGGLEQLGGGEAGGAECLGHRAVPEVGERQQQVLDAHVLVLHPLRLRLGTRQDLVHTRRDVDLAPLRAGPRDAGHARERLLEPLHQGRRAGTRLLDDARRHAALLLEQRHGQMLGLDLGVALPLGQALGLAHRILGLLGQPVGIHAPASLSVGVRRLMSRRANAAAPSPAAPAVPEGP